MRDIIYIENKYFVGTVQNSFKFKSIVDENEYYFPFDEVDYLIFDSHGSFISERVITTCVENNIGLIFCDKTHTPQLLTTSVYGQNERFKRQSNQLAVSKKTKGRIWQKIIKIKINNQADCLKYIIKNTEASDVVKSIGKTVTEGDKNNNEAYAARIYFSNLFGKSFKRGRYDDIINSSLNYGYAILRSAIRKELVIYGLEPSWGIHHVSTENPFNLSDDIIEVYRPFLDALVVELLNNNELEKLDVELKKEIIKVLFEKCIIDNKVYNLLDAIKITIKSFVSCVDKNSATGLKLPTFIEEGR